MGIKLVHVICTTCGAEVDRIEYDEGAESAAVASVQAALQVSVERARKIVEDENPGAQLTSEDNARSLAADVIERRVEGRPEDTYTCPNGHTTLQISETVAAPLVATAIVKQEGPSA